MLLFLIQHSPFNIQHSRFLIMADETPLHEVRPGAQEGAGGVRAACGIEYAAADDISRGDTEPESGDQRMRTRNVECLMLNVKCCCFAFNIHHSTFNIPVS